MEDTCKRKLNAIREAYVPLLEKYLKAQREETPIRKKLITLYSLLTSKNQILGIPTLLRTESILIKIFGQKVKAPKASMANIVSKINNTKETEIKVNENNNKSVNKVPSDDLTKIDATESDLSESVSSDKVICQSNDISSTQEEDLLSSDTSVEKKSSVEDDSTEVIKDNLEDYEETAITNTKEVPENRSAVDIEDKSKQNGNSKDSDTQNTDKQIIKKSSKESVVSQTKVQVAQVEDKEPLNNEKSVEYELIPSRNIPFSRIEKIETSDEDVDEKNASFSEREMQILTSLLDDVDSTETTNTTNNDPVSLNSEQSLSDDYTAHSNTVLTEEEPTETSSTSEITQAGEIVDSDKQNSQMSLNDEKPSISQPSVSKLGRQHCRIKLKLSPNKPILGSENLVSAVEEDLTDKTNLTSVVEEDLAIEEVVDLTEESEIVQLIDITKSTKDRHFGIIDLTNWVEIIKPAKLSVIESDKTISVPDLEKSKRVRETKEEKVAKSVKTCHSGIIDLTDPVEVLKLIDAKSVKVPETKEESLSDPAEIIKPVELSVSKSDQQKSVPVLEKSVTVHETKEGKTPESKVPVPQANEENLAETIENSVKDIVSRPIIKCIPTELLQTLETGISPLRESRFHENTILNNSRILCEDVNTKAKRSIHEDIENIPQPNLALPSKALLKNVVAQLPSVQSLMTKPVPTEKDTAIESDILSAVNELINGTDESEIGSLAVLLPEISNLVSSQEVAPKITTSLLSDNKQPSDGGTKAAVPTKPPVIKDISRMPRIKITKTKNDRIGSRTDSNETQYVQNSNSATRKSSERNPNNQSSSIERVVTNASISKVTVSQSKDKVLPDASYQIPMVKSFHMTQPKITKKVLPTAICASSTNKITQKIINNQSSSIERVETNASISKVTSSERKEKVLPDATYQIPAVVKSFHMTQPKITSPYTKKVLPTANSASSTNKVPQKQVSSVARVLSNVRLNYTESMNTSAQIEKVLSVLNSSARPTVSNSITTSILPVREPMNTSPNIERVLSVANAATPTVSNSMIETQPPILPIRDVSVVQPNQVQIPTNYLGNNTQPMITNQHISSLWPVSSSSASINNMTSQVYAQTVLNTQNVSNNMIAGPTPVVQNTSNNRAIPVVISMTVLPKRTSITPISSEHTNNIPVVTSIPVLSDRMPIDPFSSEQSTRSLPVLPDGISGIKLMLDKVPQASTSKPVDLNSKSQREKTISKKKVLPSSTISNEAQAIPKNNISRTTVESKNIPVEQNLIGYKNQSKEKVLPVIKSKPTQIQAKISSPVSSNMIRTKISFEQKSSTKSKKMPLSATKASPIQQRSTSFCSSATSMVAESNSTPKLLNIEKVLPPIRLSTKLPSMQLIVLIPESKYEKVLPASTIPQRLTSSTTATSTVTENESSPKRKHVEKVGPTHSKHLPSMPALTQESRNEKVLPASTISQRSTPSSSTVADKIELTPTRKHVEKIGPTNSRHLPSMPVFTPESSNEKVLPASTITQRSTSLSSTTATSTVAENEFTPKRKHVEKVGTTHSRHLPPSMPAFTPESRKEKVLPASIVSQRSTSSTTATSTVVENESTPTRKHIEKEGPSNSRHLPSMPAFTPESRNDKVLPASTIPQQSMSSRSTSTVADENELTPIRKHIEKHSRNLPSMPAFTPKSSNEKVLPAMKPIVPFTKAPVMVTIPTLKIIENTLLAVTSTQLRSKTLIDEISAPLPSQKENLVNLPQSAIANQEDNFYGPLRPWIGKKSFKSEMSARKMFENKNTFKSLYKCMEVNCATSTDDCTQFLTHIKAHERAGEENIMNGVQPTDQVSWLSCSYCEYVADSCNMLLLHIDKVHSTSVFQCNHCFYRSATAYNVHTHYSLHHPGIDASINVASSSTLLFKDEFSDMLACRKKFVRGIECKEDGCKFFVLRDFVTHLEENHASFNCNLCTLPLQLPIMKATQHLLCHGIGIFACIFCDFGTNTDQSMRNHISNKHSSRLLYCCARFMRKDIETDSSKVESTVLCHLGDVVPSKFTTHENTPDANILFFGQFRDLYFPQQADKHADALISEKTAIKTELPPLIIDDSQFQEAEVSEEPVIAEASEVPELPEGGNLVINEVESLANCLKSSPSKEQEESPQIEPVSNETADELLTILKARNSPKVVERKEKVDKKRKRTAEPEPMMARKRTRQSVSIEEKQIEEIIRKTSKGSSKVKDSHKKTSETSQPKTDERRSRRKSVTTIVEEPAIIKKRSTIDQTQIIDERRARKSIVEEPTKKRESSRRATIDESQIIEEKSKQINRQEEIDSFLIEEVKKTGVKKSDLYRCCSCSKRFSDRYKFQLHCLKCLDTSKSIKCYHCSSESKTVLDLVTHLNCHNQRRFMCYFCDEKTVDLQPMIDHTQNKHAKNVKEFPINPKKTDKECDIFVIAPSKFKGEDIYKYGVRLLERNSKISVKKVFQPDEVSELPKTLWFSSEFSCAVCGFGTKIRADLVSHLQKHLTTKSTTNTDGKKGATKPIKKLSIEAVQNSSSSVLDTTEETYKPVKDSTKSPKKQSKEPVRSSTTSQKEPIQDSKKLRSFPDTPKYIPDEKRLTCGAKNCNYNTRAVSLLKSHLSKHKGLYNCPHCKKEQTSNEIFMKHLELHGCLLYKCLNCKFYSASKSELLQHTEEKHNIGEDGRLTIREAFSTNVITKTKIDEVVPVTTIGHLTPTPPQIVYNCFHCTQYYSTIEELKKHWNNLHKSPKFKAGVPFQFKVSKIISCYYCNRKGAFNEIQKHSRNDHSLKPFLTINSKAITKCSECNYTITDKAEFTDHFEKNHSSIKYLNQELLDRMLILNKTQKYKCQYCDFVLDDKQEMKQHCIDRHPNENVKANKLKDLMRYSCSHTVESKQCKMTFDDELEAVKHIRSHSLYYGCNMKSCEKRFTSQKMTESHHKINHHKTGLVYPAASVNRVLDYVLEMTVIFPNGLCCTKAELCNTVYGTVDEIKERLNDLNEMDKQEVVDKRVAAKLDKKINSETEKRKSERNVDATVSIISSSDEDEEVLSKMVSSTSVMKKRKQVELSSSSSSSDEDDDFVPAPKKLRKRIRIIADSSDNDDDEEDDKRTKIEGEYSFYGLDKELVDYSKIYTVMNVGGNFIRMPCDKFGMIVDIQPSLNIEKLKK